MSYTAIFSNRGTMSGVAKTTSRLTILELLTGCKEAIVFTVKFYYTERILIKISKGKRHMGPTLGENKCKLKSVPPHNGVIQGYP